MRSNVPEPAVVPAPRGIERVLVGEGRTQPVRLPAEPRVGVTRLEPGGGRRREQVGEEHEGGNAAGLDRLHEPIRIRLVERQGLLQEQVLARRRGPQREGGLHVRRHRERDRIDVRQEGIEVVMDDTAVRGGDRGGRLVVATPDGGEGGAPGGGDACGMGLSRPVPGAHEAEPERGIVGHRPHPRGLLRRRVIGGRPGELGELGELGARAARQALETVPWAWSSSVVSRRIRERQLPWPDMGVRQVRKGHVQGVAEHAHARLAQRDQPRTQLRRASESRRSSAARSAIRRMACAPSSNASIQGRQSSTRAVFSTGPRSRWCAAASSRSASAARSAAAARPSPRSSAEREGRQGAAHDGRVARAQAGRAHVVREQRRRPRRRPAPATSRMAAAQRPPGRTRRGREVVRDRGERDLRRLEQLHRVGDDPARRPRPGGDPGRGTARCAARSSWRRR